MGTFVRTYVRNPLSVAEDDLVVGPRRAGEGAGGIVLGIAVGLGAQILEEPGVIRGAAAAGVAAVLVRLEDRAGVVAAGGRLQLAGALGGHVGGAVRPLGAAAGVGQEVHRHVEAVDEGDVEEVEAAELVEAELREGVRGYAIGGAGQHAAAIARLAVALAAGVEGAVGAGPDAAAGRAGIGGDGPGGARSSFWPPLSSFWPPPATAAAHTANEHWLVTVNVAASARAAARRRRQGMKRRVLRPALLVEEEPIASEGFRD
uniref:Uncharacterized protein n=1 Tax=Ananas comosus var. bracteatus TaxID=296719 RepID=A0A6V7QE75_ANACO|nr:unnamed protein product [Ananas comosus var. bracteatus]